MFGKTKELLNLNRENILKVFDIYEDYIMENTFGTIVDEYNEKYSKVYNIEWENTKEDICYILERIKQNSNYNGVSPMGFAYLILQNWHTSVISIDEKFDIDGLETICGLMLNKLCW